MESDEVSLRAQVIELEQLDVQIRSHLARDERVVSDREHSERVSTVDDFTADAAETDHAQHLAVQLGPGESLLLPATRFHVGVGRRDGTGRGQHERERMLGHADAVGARGVHDQDAALAGSVQIDVVDPGPGSTDDLQRGCLREQIRVDAGRASDNECVCICNVVCELFRRSARTCVDRPAFFF